MEKKFQNLCTIFIILAGIFFTYKFQFTGLICSIIAILFMVACFFILDKTAYRNKAALSFEAFSTDDNTKTVIKSISDESNGFVTTSDIVRDTNLSLKTINKAIDFLIANNLANVIKGRSGKAYSLSSKGRKIFSRYTI